MAGVGGGGGGPTYETYAGSLERSTPDNVWVPFMLFPAHIVTIRDKRNALVNSPADTGSQAYVYPVAEVRAKTTRELLTTITLVDDATMAERRNWQLYWRTPLVAKGAWNDGAPWVAVWSLIRKISTGTTYSRQVTVSWPAGFDAAYVRTVLDHTYDAAAAEVMPSNPIEAGSAAISDAALAWGTYGKLVIGGRS